MLGQTHYERSEHDHYPTPPKATEVFIDHPAMRALFQDKIVWEPACGNGAIVKVIDSRVLDTYATDLVTYPGEFKPTALVDFYSIQDLNEVRPHVGGMGPPNGIITNPLYPSTEDFANYDAYEARKAAEVPKTKTQLAKEAAVQAERQRQAQASREEFTKDFPKRGAQAKVIPADEVEDADDEAPRRTKLEDMTLTELASLNHMQILALVKKAGGQRGFARKTGIPRTTLQAHLYKTREDPFSHRPAPEPVEMIADFGPANRRVKRRFILTSAQDGTSVHEPFL